MYRNQILLFILSLTVTTSFGQNIQLLPYSTFQKTVKGNYANTENVSDDDGGYLTLQFKNNTNTPMQITSLVCKRNNSNAVAAYTAYFSYPNVIQANEYGVLVVKGSGNPYRENDSIVVAINNQTFRLKNETPKLKFANLIPNITLDTLLVYIRNDFTESIILKNIFINGRNINIANNLNLVVANDSVVPTKGICILKIPFQQTLKNCLPIYIGADFRRTSAAPTQTTGAFTRNVEPDFPIGNWWSSAFNLSNENSRKELRELHIGMTHGPGDYVLMQKAYDDYFIQTITEPSFGDPLDTSVAGNFIQQNQSKNFIKTWTIDDEPDLNGKDIAEQVLKNKTYWNNDTNTPSHVNLSVQRKYNRYGFYSDIVSMDHYAAPPAPNILSLTWTPIVGRSGVLDEALQYTEILKANTEPRRMWTWVQFTPGPWSYVQDTFAYNIQFWMHVFGGAKGIEYFVAQGDDKATYPAMWRAAKYAIYQQSAIRNLCLYGEPYFAISSNQNKVITRSLVSEKYMLIAAINNSTAYTWNGSFNPIKYNASINKNLSYEIKFVKPTWITANEIYMLGENGNKIPVTIQALTNDTFKIISPKNLGTETHIFVIGEQDNSAPTAPKNLHIIDKQDSANYTLSWNFATDNVGVQGYIVKKDNVLIDTVEAPIYIANNMVSVCPEINWTVQAIDNSGNVGAIASVVLTQNVAVPTIVIIDQTDTLSADARDTTLQLFVQAQNVIAYQWQKSIDGNFWYDIANATNDTLHLSTDSVGTKQYRCILTGNCGDKDTTGNSVVYRGMLTSISSQNKLLNRVFPNPTNGNIVIDFSKTVNNGMLRVIDIYGKIMVEKWITLTQQITLDIADFSNGMYFIEIINGTENETLTIIKQ